MSYFIKVGFKQLSKNIPKLGINQIAVLAAVLLVFGIGLGRVIKEIKIERERTTPVVTNNTDNRGLGGKYPDLANWKRPDGPLRVGLQVGHWKNDELPEELENIKKNGGTSSGGVAEWQVNLKIAQDVKVLLEEKGIVVDLLPATIPPGYWADAFVAIHADGSGDRRVAGFKVASPVWDFSGKAAELQQVIEETYRQLTGFPIDPNVTRNMTSYYAFSWRRFDHSIHPMTPAAILETGFLTNPGEAKTLVKNPMMPAQAIAQALFRFLGTS
jgi:hypothetical protein